MRISILRKKDLFGEKKFMIEIKRYNKIFTIGEKNENIKRIS